MTDLITTPHLPIEQYSVFYQFISQFPVPNSQLSIFQGNNTSSSQIFRLRKPIGILYSLYL
ncbi:hypothetical protein KSS87_000422 [Heliosperma pusillum]|nr:hypothetical protein KSS87_000422 [Heliosperma pusillum]